MSSVLDAFGIFDALVAAGVSQVVLCPGSRSAPLAYAAAAWEAAGGVRLHTMIDERAAGFYALGLARATASPVAVVVTSGTAPAHLHPAVIEAHHTATPLLVISADRPWNMQGVGASQTTTQVGLFAAHVRQAVTLPAGLGVEYGRDDSLRAVRNLVGRAVVSAARGPVHLNVSFTDPLYPLSPPPISSSHPDCVPAPRPTVAEAGDRSEPAGKPAQILEPLVRWAQARRALPDFAFPVPAALRPGHARSATLRGARTSEVLDLDAKTVIIAADPGYFELSDPVPDVAGDLASALGSPVLCEPSAQVRNRAWFCPYPQVVLTRWGKQVEQVIVVGTPSLSRPVSRLLANPQVRVVVVQSVSQTRPWPDVTGNASAIVDGLQVDAPLAAGVQQWGAELLTKAHSLGSQLEKSEVAGLGVARALWQSLTAEQVLLAGASNAVRYLDLAAERPPVATVVANRGQAGIDGTIATARGLHAGSGKSVRVLLGDMTFLHDASALVLSPGERPDVDLLVLDDAGAQIFRTLEHGAVAGEARYRQLFQMPRQVDYGLLAAGFGWQYREVDWESEGQAGVAAALAQYRGGPRLVRVRCDHRKVGEQIRQWLGQAETEAGSVTVKRDQ